MYLVIKTKRTLSGIKKPMPIYAVVKHKSAEQGVHKWRSNNLLE